MGWGAFIQGGQLFEIMALGVGAYLGMRATCI